MRDRRRSKRVRPRGRVVGRVKSNLSARVVDVSPAGVQVELSSPLGPTTVCEVTLPLPGGELRARARVLRCRATGLGPGTEADRGMCYHAGLEFLELSPAEVEMLEDLVLELTLAPDQPDEDSQPKPHGRPVKVRVRERSQG